MPKHIHKTFSENIDVHASVDKTIIGGNTGRRTQVGEGYYLAEAWSKVQDLASMRVHNAAARFQDEVAETSHLGGDELLCTRGRPDDGMIGSWEDMGPPKHAGREGRYNSAHQLALYLCGSEDGVRREFSLPPGSKLFLQDYALPLDTLRLADFMHPDVSEFISAVFRMAEISGPDTPIGRDDLVFSQLVADLVRGGGFDGMLVPGVRGDAQMRYSNAVMFDPQEGERWRDWSSGDTGFRSVII